MKSIIIKCPLCHGSGKHKVYYLPNKIMPNPEIRKTIKKLEASGMTQSDIARQLGVSRQRVWQIRKG